MAARVPKLTPIWDGYYAITMPDGEFWRDEDGAIQWKRPVVAHYLRHLARGQTPPPFDYSQAYY